MFTRFLPLAMGFGVAATVLVGAVSFVAPKIYGRHYAILVIPFMVEFFISWFFFVAFFGI